MAAWIITAQIVSDLNAGIVEESTVIFSRLCRLMCGSRKAPNSTGPAMAAEIKLRLEMRFWSAPAERSDDGALDVFG